MKNSELYNSKLPVIDIYDDFCRIGNSSFFQNKSLEKKEVDLNNRIENHSIKISEFIEDMALPKKNTIFVVTHDTKLKTPTHSHNFIEILYVVKGSILNTVDNQEIHMMQGDICIHNKNAKHSIKIIKESSIIANILILDEIFYQGTFSSFMEDTNVIADFLNHKLLYHNFLFYSAGHSKKIQNVLYNLFTEFVEADYYQTYSLEAYTLLLLNELVKLKSCSFYGINKKVRDIIEYIQNNCCTKTLEEIANDLNYTANYLTRLIKKTTGVKCSDIMINIRLNFAIKYLRETDLSIDEIANKVGYSSSSHFYRIFKKKTGMSPHQYKQTLQ